MSHQVRDSYLALIFAEVHVILCSNTDKATDKDPLLIMVVPVVVMVALVVATVAPVVMAADSLSPRHLAPLPALTLSTFCPYPPPGSKIHH